MQAYFCCIQSTHFRQPERADAQKCERERESKQVKEKLLILLQIVILYEESQRGTLQTPFLNTLIYVCKVML